MTQRPYIHGKRRLFLIFFSFFILISEKANSQDTSLLANLKDLAEYNGTDPVLLRTYDIRFTFYFNYLDTTNNNTMLFLDSLAEILTVRNVKSIDVYIHLSIKYSDEYSFPYVHAYEDIINCLSKKGIYRNKMHGHNYLGKRPIVNCFDLDDQKLIDECLKTEYKINQRVEFLIEFE